MPRELRDQRAGGERPRPTLRQRLSIKHMRMLWEAVIERMGRGFRRKKTTQNRRRKKEAKRQFQREIQPEVGPIQKQASMRLIQEGGHCFGVACGCFSNRLTYPRGRLTVMDSDLPPVYSNENVINEIVPPFPVTQGGT